MHHLTIKLVAIIVGLGAIGVALLAQRQQRVNLTNDIKVIHEEYRHHERALWQLQTEIAVRVNPSLIRDSLVDGETDWQPIPRARPASRTTTLTSDPTGQSQPLPNAH